MANPNTAANRIETAGSNSTVDVHVKRLLANKQFLSRIIKATVSEVSEYSVEEIELMIEGEPQIDTVPVDPGMTNHPSITGINSEDKVPFEGEVRYDILTYIRIPGDLLAVKILINIEGQKDASPGYDLVTRGVYYGARRISAQKDTEFTNSNYDDIKKVYSIWICFDSAPDERNTITEYSIRKNNIYGIMPDRERYDLITVVFIRLGGKLEDYEDNTLQAMLMVLFSEIVPVETKKSTLSQIYGIRMTDEVSTEVDHMCNYGQGIAERNYKRGVEDGKSQGMALGIEQGMEEGQSEMISLYLYLKEQGRLDDFEKGIKNPDYLNALIEQFRSTHEGL